MWLTDLDHLSKALDSLDAEAAEDAPSAKGRKRKAASGSGASRKRKAAEEDDENEEEAAGGDILDNPFGDIARWTSGYLKAPSIKAPPKGNAASPKKKRRTR